MKKILLGLLWCLSVTSFAQNIRFEGVIQDANKAPLEMANIMATNQSTKAMDAYAITNDKGKFSLNLKANTAYAIKLSYLGMKNKEISITTQSENITQNITMESGGIELEGVEIVREMPVSIKGDTIVYNADSFKTGTEKKLEDVLKKMPGVEVNADGEVEVEGKKVSKLMVEGKDFFDGDTKLGVKNIPADAVDKVQVLRNYNENSILKGVENNQDNIAMNIKLKEGKKNFWFGDITAGGGIGARDKMDRYIANPKVFYYSPKYSINLITNFNNIGELPLTIQDYFKMTGGFRNMMSKGGSSFNVSSNDLGISLLRNNRANNIDTKFGAANFSYNPTKTWTLSGFGIFSSSKTDILTTSQRNILSNNVLQNTTENSNQKSNFGLAKLSSSYKPNTNFQFDYDVLTKLSKQEEASTLNQETINNQGSNFQDIYTRKKQAPVSVNQNVGLYYTMDDKNVFAFEAQHLFQEEDPFYNANLENQPFNLQDYVTNQARNDINQNRLVKTNKLDAKLDYYYMVTPKSNINVTLGNTYSHQNFNSHIFQILDNGSQNDLNSTTNNNDVNYDFNDVFLGLHYKILTGKFTFTPGVSFHAYTMNNRQLGSDFKRNFTKVLPDFYALYQIKKAETLTYNFSLTNDFTDIAKLAEGFVFSNYNSLFGGKRDLENATSQVHSLRYFKYNMFNFENIFANATYTRRIDAIKSQVVFTDGNQIATPYKSNFADETLSGMGSYGRSFLKYYKASGSAALNWSKFYNKVGPMAKSTESFTQSYTLKASTNFKNAPNLELGYTYSLNEYNHTKYTTDKPFARLDYFFLKSFSWVTEYEFYHYYNNNKTVDNEYDFLSTSLVYQKKDSKWEYKISATNLLNTKSLNDNSFDQLIISNSQYYVQPRYLIFTLKYNL
ncbi:carboxypeptidase-like regulatory domain-containing protein [Flavobacterium sp. XGLA_31]|uniref:carboxypeptidase-like regulatory domain-containing protein n=1 Tax=Flavobacterium sp. XGLA_31 TaxID=3447666 RepID=UPI003F3809BB